TEEPPSPGGAPATEAPPPGEPREVAFTEKAPPSEAPTATGARPPARPPEVAVTEEPPPPGAPPAQPAEPAVTAEAAPPGASEPAPPLGERAGGASPGGERLNLNEATYEQLRALRLSVTQTGRVLAERERLGRFSSLDELDRIPGFPRAFLDDLKRKLTV